MFLKALNTLSRSFLFLSLSFINTINTIKIDTYKFFAPE